MESEELDLYQEELTEEPKYTQIIEAAFEVIKKLGISINGYDGETPKMPKDIGSLPDNELGEFLNQQTQWAGYLGSKLSEFESYLTVLQNELEFAAAAIHSGYLRDDVISRTKITERKELMKTDKRYVALNREKLRYEIICNIIKANLNATNNNWVNLSRQITLKGQDQQREFRSHNAINYIPSEMSPKGPNVRGFNHTNIGSPPNKPTPKRKQNG